MLEQDAPWYGKAMPFELRERDFADAAERLRCDIPAIKAVWEVEAGGQHFYKDGTVIRRFEPHHFPKGLWSDLGFSVRPGEAPWRASLRQSSEAMFQRAVKIDMEAAIAASSWGAPQIMAGMNHKAAGFDSPVAMVRHMARGADAQLGAFVQLVEGWGIDTALRAHDWTAFARRYNGSGQVAEYARRMETAYRKHSGGAKSPVVLRVGTRGEAVTMLQQLLGVDVDGAFGPATHAAVIAFQKKAGLAADGIVGAKTWDALQRLVYAPMSKEIIPTDIIGSMIPAQDSLADHIQREAGKITGVVSAVATAAVALDQAVGDLPPPIVFGGGAGAVIGGLLWLLKRRKVN